MYKNLKIGKKLFIGFASIALLSVVMMVFTLLSLNQVGNLSHSLYVGPYVSTTQSMGIRHDLNVIGKEIRNGILAKDMEKYKPTILKTKESMDSRVNTLKTVFGGDSKLITNFESSAKNLVIERDRIFLAMEEKDYEKATNLVLTSYYEAFLKVSDAADILYQDADKRGAEFDKTAQNTSKNTYTISISLLIVCLGLATMMAVISTRSITRPTKQVELAIAKMAEGSLNVTVDYQSNDEIGILAQGIRSIISSISGIIGDIRYMLGEMANGNFNIDTQVGNSYIGDYAPILVSMKNINAKLSETLSQINQASDQVSSGSDQVSSGAQALSQGATEQASSVQELAATITEISEQVKANAKNAESASSIVNQSVGEIAASNEKMQQLIVAMSEISNSSQEIGKVIKTIEDIAFQTNILALNASVEAARAGAAGKGFAIVADEVRNLASKSAEAAKGTTALIEGAVNAVKNGTRLADDTAKSLIAVVDVSNEAAHIVDRISSDSVEQSLSIAQITQGIDQISSVVQTNSATAEESAASSEELSSQAQILKELVGKFTLQNSEKNYTVSHYNGTETPVKRIRNSSSNDKY